MEINYLESGKILTGMYGKRYITRSFVGATELMQVYTVVEHGIDYWAVAVTRGGAKVRTKLVEQNTNAYANQKSVLGILDSFVFTFEGRDYFGMIIEPCDFNFSILKYDSPYTMEQRYKIAINLAIAFKEFRELGYVNATVPAVAISEELDVKLIPLPARPGSHQEWADYATMGYNAPECFKKIAKAETTSYESDRFLYAAMVHRLIFGIGPFETKANRFYSYEDYVFDTKTESLAIKYGYSVGARYRDVRDDIKELFTKTFKKGVNEPKERPDEDEWIAIFIAAITGKTISGSGEDDDSLPEEIITGE